MTKLEIFKEYIKHRDPNIKVLSDGGTSWCYGMPCKECGLEQDCRYGIKDGSTHYFSREEVKEVMIKYPEYFV